MVNKLNDAKATKEELMQTNALIENLNERVKHISILQNELAIMLEPIRNSVNIFDEKMKK